MTVAGRSLVVGALLLFAICVLFAEENWRGRRAWELCRRELDAKKALDWQQFVPPLVPDDQNFASTPFLAPLLDFDPRRREAGQSPWRDPAARERAASFAAVLLPQNKKGEVPSAVFDGQMTDFPAALALLRGSSNQPPESIPAFSSRAEAASATLAALNQFEPVIEELRSASRRPYSRFNVEYDSEDPLSILLPHYAVLNHVTRALEVRASAELALGKSEAAFEDVEMMRRLAGSIENEPFVIGMLMRDSMMKRTVQIIWEGLASRNWSEPQLKQFQEQLQSIKPLHELDRVLRAERTRLGDATFRFIRAHKNALRDWMASEEAPGMAYLLVGPEGWIYQEQVTYHRLYDERVLAGFDADSGHLQPHVIDGNRAALDRELARSSFWHHNGFCRLVLSKLMRVFQKAAAAQDHLNQAATACALERYRLANGKFPDTLAALTAQFMEKAPMDVCDGQSLKYRLLPDGAFVLYSVGWNEKDDGGTVVAKAVGDFVPKEGDWVWPAYPKSGSTKLETNLQSNGRARCPNAPFAPTPHQQKLPDLGAGSPALWRREDTPPYRYTQSNGRACCPSEPWPPLPGYTIV